MMRLIIVCLIEEAALIVMAIGDLILEIIESFTN